MPSAIYDTKADYDAAYSISAEGPWGVTRPREREVRLSYCRCVVEPYNQATAKLLKERFSLGQDSAVVIVGAGFGWTIEALATLGIARIVGTETSSWIHEAKNTTEREEVAEKVAEVGADPVLVDKILALGGADRPRCVSTVLNEDINSYESHKRVIEAIGIQPTHVISEYVLDDFNPVEGLALSVNMHLLVGRGVVAHVVSRDRAASWSTILPADVIVGA